METDLLVGNRAVIFIELTDRIATGWCQDCNDDRPLRKTHHGARALDGPHES